MNVAEIWPKKGKGSWYKNRPTYEQLVARIAPVVSTEMLGDYQGDYFILFKKGTRYGFLEFGYGSCSGCDALEACDTEAELQILFDELESSVRWYDDRAGLETFLKEHDWKGSYYGDEGRRAYAALLLALGDA